MPSRSVSEIVDELPANPLEALTRRNRPPLALAHRPLCCPEERCDATRQEELELVAGAHLRLAGRLLVSFTLESLSFPPSLPRLFALHADTVARGSDKAGRAALIGQEHALTTVVMLYALC